MEVKNYSFDILWDAFERAPILYTHNGRKLNALKFIKNESESRNILNYSDKSIELSGIWKNSDKDDKGKSSVLSFKLKNVSSYSIELAHLVFKGDHGFNKYLGKYKKKNISFLRNGYQSWSAAKVYRFSDKIFLSWLSFVVMMSSNGANLPTSKVGELSSEMFTLINKLNSNDSFFIGQAGNFNQFFYYRLFPNKSNKKKSFFDLIIDFGNKIIEPGEEIILDDIYISRGHTNELLSEYTSYINQKKEIKIRKKTITGWCTWYCYYNKISPEIIKKNIDLIKKDNYKIEYIQIDDGYENCVGDWLDLKPEFKNKMKYLTDHITASGYKPALWIAPFIAEKKSKLLIDHPEFILRDKKGKAIEAGLNTMWKGLLFYCLDITNPLFQDYLRKTLKTIVEDWGFSFLKLDFLYAACRENAFNRNLKLSRSEIMKLGINLIRTAVPVNTLLLGCGVPLAPSVGNLHNIRIGVDTAPYWTSFWASLLGNKNEMIGARNCIRNSLVRSFMNNTLWKNDPDCIMVRSQHTKLNKLQIATDINVKLISGSVLMLSDAMADLDEEERKLIHKVLSYHESMSSGRCVCLDLMEKSMPEIIYNTNGYLAIINFKKYKRNINLNKYINNLGGITALENLWTGEIINNDGNVEISGLKSNESILFKIIGERFDAS